MSINRLHTYFSVLKHEIQQNSVHHGVWTFLAKNGKLSKLLICIHYKLIKSRLFNNSSLFNVLKLESNNVIQAGYSYYFIKKQ